MHELKVGEIMSRLIEVLTSQSLIEKSVLLVLTAILTGIFAPLINSQMEKQKFREQRIFDAEVSREAKVIDAQDELLSEIEGIISGFLLRALTVV
jgi:hypothetical protein